MLIDDEDKPSRSMHMKTLVNKVPDSKLEEEMRLQVRRNVQYNANNMSS